MSNKWNVKGGEKNTMEFQSKVSDIFGNLNATIESPEKSKKREPKKTPQNFKNRGRNSRNFKKKTPDYVKNPQNWTKYDFSEDDEFSSDQNRNAFYDLRQM